MHSKMTQARPEVLKEEKEDDMSFDSDESEEDLHFIRCKWQGDGATTLEELIGKMHNFIAHLRNLQKDGWELSNPMDDDWGLIVKKEKQEVISVDDEEAVEKK